MSEAEVDERTQEALATLFEQFWVLRQYEPAAYYAIREKELVLKRFIAERYGYDLIVHQHFAKLEKLPVEPKSWMGIQDFTEVTDYVLFCCAMAFTEGRSAEEQFLLSDITDFIMLEYPGDVPIEWTNYQHRRSLIRVLKKMADLRIMREVDGNIESFQQSEEEEVLYEVTVYARYFMRAYPEDLVQYEKMEELLESEWKRNEEGYRRKRVYRKLMLSPFVYRNGEEDLDFAYIRNFRNRLREDFEANTPFGLEVFKNTALLTLPENRQRHTLYPDKKNISEIGMQVAAVLREKRQELVLNDRSEIRLSLPAFEQLIAEVKKRFGSGWGKQHRIEPVESTAEQLIDMWLEWEMAEREPETNIVVLKSGIARSIAHYNREALKNLEKRGETDGSK